MAVAFQNPVAIFSVSRQANMLPGSATWPILQPQQFVSPNIFWNINAVAGGGFHIQPVAVANVFLAPGGDRNSCVLRAAPFVWQVVRAGGDDINPVNLYNIRDPANGNLLQSGYRFADPGNAYAVLSQAGNAGSALASWVIVRVPQ